MSPSARGQKRDRERARAERAVVKKERREQRLADNAAASDEPAEHYDEADVLAALADLHRRFADEAISHEEFEEQRDLLTARLRVD